MRRRALMLLLPLAAALPLAPAAFAQAIGTTGTPPSDAPPQAGSPPPARPDQPRLYQLDYDQLNPQQKRRLQQALAGEGKPPMAADEARRTWNGMTEAQRRQFIRRARAAMQGQAAPGGTGARDTPR